MIKLFNSTSTDFSTNGIGYLSDAISCVVHEERNGEFELEMTYPITGKRYSEITLNRIIVTKPNPYDKAQPFRIYSITKPINGVVTVNAAHISYDLSGYPVAPFSAGSAGTAFINMQNASVLSCPFIFWTDKTDSGIFSIEKPASIRSVLGGSDNSFVKSFGGELEFDNYDVKLHNNRGINRGVSIRYGKNLTDLEQEENCSEVFTGVYPFWYSEEQFIELTEKYIQADGSYDFVRIYPLDLSSEFDDPPTESELRYAALSWMNDNKIGIPKVSLKVSFVPLSQSEEYKNYSILEMVRLCDIVNVEFPELGVSATSKCISTTYDVLTDKYTEIELGEPKSNLETVIVEQNRNIKDVPTKTFLEQSVDHATSLITGGLGGYVILHNSFGQSKPDEILVMDTEDIHTAVHVWRWNKEGLGFSSTGYEGPYATAMTSDGKIVANFITAGELNGNIIKAHTVSANAISLEYTDFINNAITGSAETLREEFVAADGVLRASISDTYTYAMGLANDAEKNAKDYADSKLSDYVPTALLDSKVSLYMTSAAGISDIELAASGKFVKPAELTEALLPYLTEDDLPDFSQFVEMLDLDTSIRQYINSAEGTASIISAAEGTFVKPADLSNYATVSSVASVSQRVTNLSSDVSLDAAYGSNTVGSNVRAMLQLFANADSSNIRLAANALTLTATPLPASTVETEVGELSVVVGSDDNIPYPFEKTNDGFWTSTNAGLQSTYSYAHVDFNFSKSTKIIVRCCSYGESNYDFGIISNVGKSLSMSSVADSADVFHSFKGESSSSFVDIEMTIPAGSQYITLKYIKDGSQNSGGDYFKFKCLLVTESASTDTVLSLLSGGVTLSTANLHITGVVTFADLLGDGTTKINGANIMTDNLKVKTIYHNFGENSNIDFPIMYSEFNKSLTRGTVWIGNTTDSNIKTEIELSGDIIDMIPSCQNYNHEDSIEFDLTRNQINFNNDKWNLGSTTHPIGDIFSKNYTFDDDSYLTIRSGRLAYYDADGNRTYLT